MKIMVLNDAEYVLNEERPVDPVKDVRRAFAIVDDVIYMQHEDDRRPMRLALAQELDVRGEILGGFIDYSDIVFFMHNAEHDDPELSDITEDIVMSLKQFMNTNNDVAVWAGVEKGKTGTLWPMKIIVGYVTCDNEYYEFKFN